MMESLLFKLAYFARILLRIYSSILNFMGFYQIFYSFYIFRTAIIQNNYLSVVSHYFIFNLQKQQCMVLLKIVTFDMSQKP